MLSRRSLFAAVGGLFACAALPRSVAKKPLLTITADAKAMAEHFRRATLAALTRNECREAREFMCAKMSRKS